MINVEPMIELLGNGEKNPELLGIFIQNNININDLSMRDLKKLGSTQIQLFSEGVEIVFVERDFFERKYGKPKSLGDAIFAGVFVCRKSFQGYQKHTGTLPIINSDIKNREEAIEKLGQPNRIEEEGGVVEWDQWVVNETQLRINYDANTTNPAIVTYSVPMK